MDDPITSRRLSPATRSSSSSSTAIADPPAAPLPLRQAMQARDADGDSDMLDSTTAHQQQLLSRSSPLQFLTSTASSPSRALSRIWDRFSPPSIPSPFSGPHPPNPGQVLAGEGRGGAASPNAPPPSSDGSALPTLFNSPGDAFRFRRTVGAHNLPSGAVTPAEERELASQLSFSLRSRGNGSSNRDAGGSFGRSARPPKSMTAGEWDPPMFRMLPEVRMPAVLGRGSRKGKERERIGMEAEEDEMMVDDEACFVDGWEGKVDFLVSLPSELSLSILLHLALSPTSPTDPTPDFRSLLSASLVSHAWRHLALDPLLWRTLFHEYNPRWLLKPEVYRAADAAAAAAAQAALLPGGTATPTPLPPSSPALSTALSNYFDSHRPHPPPLPPSLKRAASSFSRAASASSAGAKRAYAAGADRVQNGAAGLGRKISEIAGEMGGLGLANTSSDGPGAERSPSVVSQADSGVAGSSSGPTTRPPPPPVRRPTHPHPALLSPSLGTAGQQSLAALPSLSTAPQNAFAPPPSSSSGGGNGSAALSTLSRSNSFSALSSLNALPTSPQTPSSSHTPRVLPRPLSLALPSSSPAPPTFTAPPTPHPPLALDWPSLFSSRYILEKRWERGQPSWNWLEGHGDSVYCVQFDDGSEGEGGWGAGGGKVRDRTIRIWDLTSGLPLRTLTGHEGSVLCLQYDSRILVSGSSDSRILVWDFEHGSESQYEVKMQLVGHSAGVLDLCFDKDWIVSCSKDTTTRVWSRQNGALYRTLSGHRGPVNAVQLHGSQVLSASGDALIKLWDIHTGQALRTFTGHARGLACIHWAQSGRYFVSGCNDKTIKLWDVTTGECVQTFVGHADLVRSLWYDESGEGRVVSASYDRTTRVWNARTGEQVVKYKSHASLVFDVEFDARRIVSSSHDQRILVMDFGVGLEHVDKFA
ncbi:hypothetical protein JCM11251_002250 [Rhodosporidiobolus azoricus]